MDRVEKPYAFLLQTLVVFVKKKTTTTNSQKNIRAVEEIDVQSIVFKGDGLKEEFQELIKILDYEEIDVNKDGVVSLEEFSEALKKFYLKKLRDVPENFVPGGKKILRIVKENLTKSSKKIAKPLFDFIDLDGNGTIQKHEADILLLPMAVDTVNNEKTDLQKKLVPKLPNVFLSVMYLLFDKNDDGDITKDEIVKRVSGFLSSITRFLIELIDFATDVASQVLQEKPELAEM